MPFDISIIIPSWNGLHLLRESLPSVLEAAHTYRRATGRTVEIIIVDDASQDDTTEALPIEFPEVRLLNQSHNRGFAATCNAGIRSSRFPLIALINNDVRLDQHYLFYQALHFEDPEVLAVTAKVFDWHRPIFASGGKVGRFRRGFWSVYFNYDVSHNRAGEWIDGRRLLSAYAVGGFSCYERAKLQTLGGFTELLSPFHWEDIDLSYRGWKRGWTVRYEPRSIAYHRTSATINTYFRKRHVETIAVRNRMLFHWINLHSCSYWIRHLLMLQLLFISRACVLDTSFYRSLLQALRRCRETRQLRKEEQLKSCRSDVEIARLLENFYGSAPIDIYYNQRDVIERHPDFKEARA